MVYPDLLHRVDPVGRLVLPYGMPLGVPIYPTVGAARLGADGIAGIDAREDATTGTSPSRWAHDRGISAPPTASSAVP